MNVKKPIVHRFDSEEEWRAARKRFITATDSRKILPGIGYSGESALSCYEEKLSGDAPEFSEATEERFAIGKAAERFIGDVFQLKTGIQLRYDRSFVLRANAGFPWMAATLDAWSASRSIEDARSGSISGWSIRMPDAFFMERRLSLSRPRTRLLTFSASSSRPSA